MATMVKTLVYIPATSYQEGGVQQSYDVQHSRRFLWYEWSCSLTLLSNLLYLHDSCGGKV